MARSRSLGVSVARGNVVPADHGIWIVAEDARARYPPLRPRRVPSAGCNCGTARRSRLHFLAFIRACAVTADLQRAVRHGAPRPPLPRARQRRGLSRYLACRAMTAAGGPAGPASSDTAEHVFVPEIEYDGSVFLRFGDDQYGMAPGHGVEFSATYRIGNGAPATSAATRWAHASFRAALPAAPRVVAGAQPAGRQPAASTPRHGTHPPVRALFLPDAASLRHRGRLRPDGRPAHRRAEARGTLRWTGSWYTAFVSIDPADASPPQLIDDTPAHSNMLRMMGTDLVVEGAVIVGLRIELEICVDPELFPGRRLPRADEGLHHRRPMRRAAADC